MTFEVLSAQGADIERWHDVLERFPPHLRDLHYLPEYGLIYQDSYGYEPMLAVWEEDGIMGIHAFLRRPLKDLAFLAGEGARAFFDIATPYGFGGPLLSREETEASSECLRNFDVAFRRWCVDEHLASEFACLHPVLGNHAAVAAAGTAALNPAKEVVVLDLQAPDETLWGEVSRGTRSSIQLARREGVVVERVEADEQALRAFNRLYVDTMKRRGAAGRWFFPDSYFSDCIRWLGPQRSALFFARCEGEIAAAFLLLNDGHTAYYHFGGSDERWLGRRPNNLLMFETMQWAKRQGLSRYHLGGGVTASGNDSLLRFKSSVGGRRAVLYTYCRILNEDVYRVLCELKLRHEERVAQAVADPDYFPFYRR